jgi:hypothetical protein
MAKRFLLLVFLSTLPGFLRADKIIMKDGKIYYGHIMGETQHSVLISNPPVDPKPRFIELRDVMTIVRERRPAEKPSPEEERFASVSAGIVGQVFTSNIFSFTGAPGLYFGGGFRVHPALELGAELDYVPALSGHLTVVDTQSQNSRSYQNFYAYQGGFSAKLFPFYQHKQWRAEPYFITGYHWSRLIPNGSEDELKGTSLFGGAGLMIPWWKPLYWDFRAVYDHTQYDSIHFLGNDGDLSGVDHNAFEFSVGLSYRFL